MEIIVNFDDIRLDKFFRIYFDKYHIPQSFIEKSIRNRQILVDGIKHKSSYRLHKGQRIFYSSNFDLSSFIYRKKQSIFNNNIDISKYIIYEDDSIISINKPFGIPVQGGTGIKYSIIDLMKTKYSNIFNPYIVHRLDKDTSGVLLFAKNRETACYLCSLFANRNIKKVYHALVHGIPTKKKGIVDISLRKSIIGNEEMMVYDLMQHNNQSLKSITYYNVLSSTKDASFVELIPLTGRKHQLRVHMKYLNCPIIGDLKYSDQRHLEKIRCNKMNLYAYSIKFNMSNGKMIYITADMPQHMSSNMLFFGL